MDSGTAARRETCAHAALVAALVVGPGVAHAQLCHVTPLQPPHDTERDDRAVDENEEQESNRSHRVHASITGDFATLDGHNFQGLHPAIAWRHWRVEAYAIVPLYRIVNYAETTYGPGDLGAGARVRVVGAEAWAVGLSLGATAATGDADHGLGMGHTMVMPGAWSTLRLGPWRSELVVVAAKAIGDSGDDGGHRHHSHGITVAPMNAFEVATTARSAFRVAGPLDVHTVGVVAPPIGDGTLRAAAGGGASLRRHAWTLTGESQVGIAGDPFTVRALLSITREL